MNSASFHTQVSSPATQDGILATAQATRRIGSVGYLNSRPLVDGLEGRADPLIRFDVPSRLLSNLESGQVDIALCPVIDYYRSHIPLQIVPVGGIGCNGPTLTVRLFSRVRPAQIQTVHADIDSHTSITLLRIFLTKRYGITPDFIDYDAHHLLANPPTSAPPETLLLIGDKVVTNRPTTNDYPYQLDLGEAWYNLTGLPFVFAVWMAKPDTRLGNLPTLLQSIRIENCNHIDRIVARHAENHGWPNELALDYLTRNLSFEIGPRQLEAIERFGVMANDFGLIDNLRPLHLRDGL